MPKNVEKTCQRRSAEPCVSPRNNGKANGFVQIDKVHEETEELLPERKTHVQNSSFTNLKCVEEVPAPRLFKAEDSDASSTSSGQSTGHVSDVYNIETASRQQEQKPATNRRDTEVIIKPKNTGLSAVKQQDGAVVVYNDFKVTQNVCGHKTDHCETCLSPPNLPNTQSMSPDITTGIPM